MPKVPIRPSIDALPTYVPGAKAAAGKAAFKLSSNESPYPPLPGVLAAVSDAAVDLHRYPDMAANQVADAVALFHGVEPGQVAVGAGSVAVLGHMLAAVTAEGDEVVYPWRSFEAYPILVGIAGGESVQVPLADDGRADLEAMAAAITPKTRVVMVCTPNNPTGPTVRQDEFEEFMKAVPADVLVAVDEAYAEFVTDPEALQPFPLLDRYPNMVVLRTFSKAYGLAGLRVGYAVGRPRIISAIRAATTPFSVGSMAQMAAVLSLQMQDQMRQRVQQIVATRSVLADGLRAQGWEIPDPQGNFVWLDLGADAAAFAQAASNAGVIVRPFAGEGVRITVAEPESVERVLAVTETWI